MTPTLARIGAVVLVSGCCSLVYQVAWLRLLRLVFGSSTASTAAVLAIFMGGLGLGGAWLGRRAEKARNPLVFYAGLEIGIALTAAASPLLIAGVSAVYLGLGGVETLGLGAATALRLLLCVAVLGVPTTLMGGTLPAVAQAMEGDADAGRRRVAALYGVNTLGAVAGALLTTFLLIELLGVRQTLWLAAALNLLLAMAVRSMARTAETIETAPPPVEGPPAAESPPAGASRAPGTSLVLFTAFAVGFVFFLMELVWYRMLAPVLGGTSYTFGLILALALLGIAAGGALYSLGPEGRRPGLAGLAWTCALEAVCLAAPFAAGDGLALAAAVLRQLSAVGFGGLVLSWTAVLAFVVLPAAVVAGYQFPLLVGLLGSGRRHVGSQVGLAYAWNTWGAILGSLAGGFVLMPLLTAPLLWRLSALSLVALAAVLALAGRRQLNALAVAGLAAAGLAGVAASLAAGPTAFWRHVPIGAGRLEVSFSGVNDLRRKVHQERRSLVREAEGVESSVALMRFNELSLFVNGKSDGSVRTDAPTMVWSALVGALLHPEPRCALVIGLGSGTTAGWLAQVDGMERVDVVELEPAVIELAPAFAAVTFDALALPNVRVRAGDGRERVLATPRRYDLVMSQPSNPYRAGVADLFSQDFYRAVEGRLAPGGLFMQWLQGYEVDAAVVGTVYATLTSVFPYVESWQINATDLLLLAGRAPLVHDLERVRRRVGEEPFAAALARTWRVEGLEGFYSGFLGGHELARALAADHQVSTDDRPRAEFGFARTVGRTGLFPLSDLQVLSSRLGRDRPPGAAGLLDPARLREMRHVRHVIETFLEAPPATVGAAEARRREAREAYRDEDLAGALRAWRAQPLDPFADADRFLLAEALAQAGDPEAAARIAALAGRAPTEAAFFAARLALRQGDAVAAAAHLERAFLSLRGDGWVFRPVARRGFELIDEVMAADQFQGRRLLGALAEPFAVLLFEEGRLVTRVNLAARVDFRGECVAAFADLEPHVIWEEGFLTARRRCYEAGGHPLAPRAARDLRDFLEHAPPALPRPEP